MAAVRYIFVLASVLIFSSCLKEIQPGNPTHVSYYMTNVYFAPLPYRTPLCALQEGKMNATLKYLNGTWIPDTAYIKRDYTVNFYMNNDTNFKLTFEFPFLRRGESASYYYTANYVWTAKGPNSVKMSGKMKVGKYVVPFTIGDKYNYDTLSVINTGGKFRVQGCDLNINYNVNGVDATGILNFDLGWEDFK
jgi:hypothetical protein